MREYYQEIIHAIANIVSMVKEKKILEKDIQRDICDALERYGFCFWRSNNVPVFSKNNAGKMSFRSLPKHTPKGLPDIMVVVEGRFVGLEVKQPDLKLSEHQKTFENRIHRAGGFYYKVSSKEEALSYLAGVIESTQP